MMIMHVSCRQGRNMRFAGGAKKMLKPTPASPCLNLFHAFITKFPHLAFMSHIIQHQKQGMSKAGEGWRPLNHMGGGRHVPTTRHVTVCT